MFSWYKVPYALPMEGFGNLEDGEMTWESWGRLMKKQHPVQWFLRHTLLYFWFDIKRHTWGRITRFIYWFNEMVWRKQHLLDMRNKTCGYKFGYVDPPTAIFYSCFNIFEKFCNDEDGLTVLATQALADWSEHCRTPEEMAKWDEHAKKMIEVHKTAKDLHQWWCLGGRQHEHYQVDKLYQNIPKGRSASRSEAMTAWVAASDALDVRDNTQLAKLISIKDYLWT